MMQTVRDLFVLVMLFAAIIWLGVTCIGGCALEGTSVSQLSPIVDIPLVSPGVITDVDVSSGGVAAVKQEISGIRADAEVGVGDVTGLSVNYSQAMPIGLFLLLCWDKWLSHRREMCRLKNSRMRIIGPSSKEASNDAG